MRKLLLSTFFALSVFALQAETFQVDFSNPAITITKPKEIAAKVVTGPGVRYNSYYQNSWLMNFSGSSFIEVTFTNNLSEGTPAALNFVHLSSLVGPNNYSPLTITLNDKEVAKGFSPQLGDAGYQTNSFDITSFVKTGENVLRIQLEKEAFSNYWIQNLEISFQ
jgi:hypothetical protein